MKCKSKLLAFTLALFVLIFAGCGEIAVPTGNATLDPTSTKSPFNNWTPMEFLPGQTIAYKFQMKTEAGIVTGTFRVEVTGKAPAGIYFYWKSEIGSETETGNFHGTSDGFVKKIENEFDKSYILKSLFSVLFAPLRGTGEYSMFIADYDNLRVGESWTSKIGDKVYDHMIIQTSEHGGVEGYDVVSYLKEELMLAICISPFCPLPIMSTYYIGTLEDGSSSYVFCELEGITV